MDGVQTGTSCWKIGNCMLDEESQSEERLCVSILKGLDRGTILADVEEEQEQDVICFDESTELP